MTVTSVEAVTKTRYRVFLDGQSAFILYKGELSHYHLAEGREIDESVYNEILTEVILKRAKLRAMHLLNDMDRTEEQLRTKLQNGEYPKDIIDQAVVYVKSYGYINDENYARRFIENKKNRKSRKEIYALLCRKGLKRELVEEALEAYYDSGDTEDAIREILRKKRYIPEQATEAEKQKLYAYLVRKGFRYEDIRQVIQVSGWNA